MTWVKLDDGYYRHPKSRAIGRDGRALHLASMCWCAANLTDGIIRRSDLPLLLAEAEVKRPVVDVLVEHRAWLDHPDGWEVKDFLAYNRSAASVRAERDEAAERMRRNRERRSAERKANVQANNERSSPYPDPTRPDPTPSSNSPDNDDSPSVDARSSSVDEVLDLIVAGLAHQAFKTSHGGWRASTLRNQRAENSAAIADALAAGEPPLDIAARYADPVHIRLATGADQ